MKATPRRLGGACHLKGAGIPKDRNSSHQQVQHHHAERIA